MGFAFTETMSGTYAPIQAPKDHRTFTFTLEARARSILKYLRDGETEIRGTLRADQLADSVPIEGTLTFAPRRRAIEYQFRFVAGEAPYRFSGRKTLGFRDLARSFTELVGEIYDQSGSPFAKSVTYFDVRADLIPFLKSFRLG